MKKIRVTLENKEFIFNPYSKTIKELFLEQGFKEVNNDYHDNPIIAALVNNNLYSLNSLLTVDAKIEAVYLFSDIGKMIYRRSLSFLLSYACNKIFGKRTIVIEHSLGDGYFYSFEKIDDIKERDINKIKKEMQNIIESGQYIYREKWSYESLIDYFNESNAKKTSSLLSYKNEPSLVVYRLNNYIDLTNIPLVSNTNILQVWDLMDYENGMILRYPRSFNFHKIEKYIDNPLLFKVLQRAKKQGKILKLDCLGSLNKICLEGQIKETVMKAEAVQSNTIAKIANEIKNRKYIKTVSIAGPSSSGKTTTSCKVKIALELLGYNCIRISLDNYYHKAINCPLNPDGSKDYEALEALDLPFLRKQIKELYEGKEVVLPIFDFHNQKRLFEKKPTILKENDILILEGIHGLNPKLLPNIEPNTQYKIYVSALTQLNFDNHNRISTTDSRLLRRMVRDKQFRGTKAIDTINMWKSVVNGENKHIFPFQNNADFMINSALDYELGVIATFAKPLLMTIKPSDGKAYYTSRRLLSFIDNIYPIPSTIVPPNSLLREFIGGSVYDV